MPQQPPGPSWCRCPENREPGSKQDAQSSAPRRQPKAPAPPPHPSLAPGSLTTLSSLTGGPRSAPPVSTAGSATGTSWASLETPAGWNNFRLWHAAIGCLARDGANPISHWLRFLASWWNTTGQPECWPDRCRGVPNASVCGERRARAGGGRDLAAACFPSLSTGLTRFAARLPFLPVHP